MEDNLLHAMSKQLFLEFNVVAKTATYSTIAHIDGLDIDGHASSSRWQEVKNNGTLSDR